MTTNSISSADVCIEFDDVVSGYKDFMILNNLSFKARRGAITLLIGPNGAGKSTVLKTLFGLLKPRQGKVLLNGENINGASQKDLLAKGIAFVPQGRNLFGQLSVYENLELATAADKRVWWTLTQHLNSTQKFRIDEVLVQIGLQEHRFKNAGALSHGQKQWLEIGMLLMQNPRVLLVDEPVAGMTGEETEKTAELLLSLAGDHSVIVVEHDMKFVRSIARKVTVLHQGSVLTEGTMDQVQNDPKVIEVYLGE
jgi:urea transport system ATP-binding protein